MRAGSHGNEPMNESPKPPEELDNNFMAPEEMMEIFPWPISMIQQLCEEIQEDSEAGHY